MRKILLGTTAVVAAGMLSAVVTPAAAQTAPTVRIGGSMAAYWGYTLQNGRSNNSGLAGGTTQQLTTGSVGGTAQNLGGLAITGPIPAAGGTVGGPLAVGAAPAGIDGATRMGTTDFVVLPAINFLIDAKLANGLAYGAQIALNMNSLEGRQFTQRRSSAPRTTMSIDEAWIYMRHPTFGEIRFGDEDGPVGGLMNAGWITGFGTGGVFGAWEQFGTRAANNRTMTAPGGIGDNSKIVYLSPQYFGFDFGASFSPNLGEGGSSGCPNDIASASCDRAWAFRGASGAGITAAGGSIGARRNEFQLSARYRGEIMPGLGVQASVGYLGSAAARDITNAGASARTMRGLDVWMFGAQASYAGFTVGAAYSTGAFNWFWGNLIRGSRNGQQVTAGIQYTMGPVTVGGNIVSGLFEGGARSAFDPATGAVNALAPGSAGTAMQRRWGWGVGANYRLAPGLDLIAEYAYHSIREPLVNPDINLAGAAAAANAGRRAQTQVLLVGTRLAF